MGKGEGNGRRSLIGRLGGLTTSARQDTTRNTANARHAFLDRFMVEVDPQGLLTLEERERRAVAARRAHFLRLAMRSAAARSGRKQP
jgi:hypothetical protein